MYFNRCDINTKLIVLFKVKQTIYKQIIYTKLLYDYE